MDKRWQLIADPNRPCGGGVILSGSGTPSVNGTYCPDGIDPVWSLAMWTKVGGTKYEDSIYADPDTGNLFVTSGGLAADDIANVKFTGTAGFPPTFIPVEVGEPFGGVNPAPTAVMIPASPDFFIDVNPLNPAKFTEERNLNDGQIFFRRKLSTTLVFVGADYARFNAMNMDSGRRCEDVFIRYQEKCSGRWRTLWTGVFSVGAGGFNHDSCQFSIRPTVIDRYSCILDRIDRKMNLLAVPPETVSAIVIPQGIQFSVTGSYGSLGEAGTMGLMGYADTGLDFDGRNLYWREVAVTECVNGAAVPPPGSGWVLRVNSCAGTYSPPIQSGRSFWTRHPTIAYTFGTPLHATTPPYASPCDGPYAMVMYHLDPFESGNTDLEEKTRIVNRLDLGHWYICLNNGTPIEYTRARKFIDCLTWGLEKLGCSVQSVKSDFFQWNPDVVSTDNYVLVANGDSYVTNDLTNLFLIHNDDALLPTATNPGRIGEWTVSGMLRLLSVFQVFWDIDDDGRLVLEHWIYWSEQDGIDVRAFDNSEPLEYESLSAEIPSLERIEWMVSSGEDFIGKDIEYSGSCVGGRESLVIKTKELREVITDIALVQSSGALNDGAVDKLGWTLLACREGDTGYNVIIAAGKLTGGLVTNEPLSTASIMANYWLWNRYLPSGRLNDADVDFKGYEPTIKQTQFMVKLCCSIFEFDPRLPPITRLGALLNSKARVVSAVYDDTGVLTLSLTYSW